MPVEQKWNEAPTAVKVAAVGVGIGVGYLMGRVMVDATHVFDPDRIAARENWKHKKIERKLEMEKRRKELEELGEDTTYFGDDPSVLMLLGAVVGIGTCAEIAKDTFQAGKKVWDIAADSLGGVKAEFSAWLERESLISEDPL